MSYSTGAVFRPVDEKDYRLYRLFRDEVFPLRQKWQDFEEGKYFPSEAAASLIAKTVLIFENLPPTNNRLIFSTETILRTFIASGEDTNTAFERSLVAFTALVRSRGNTAAIVIDDSDNEGYRNA